MLSSIVCPSQLKGLTLRQLEELSLEIRRRIIDVMSINGGHLASNLGSVDFILALHFVFNSPKDKLIFDTSHQSYPHKLLTGRNERFETIRQYRGLCGFSHPFESPHDPFFSGHAGTALSLGLGMARERDLRNGDEHIIPILGDADLTCGVTLEALNNVPQSLGRFMTVLNDNEMAIYKNVGAITKILSRAVNSPISNEIYQEIKHLLMKVPGCGEFLTNKGRKLKESLKNLVSAAPFFEQFELSYVGPIDGHDLSQLIDTFQALKDCPKATLVHILTTKGKGMDVASANPIAYHGVRPFDCLTGKFHPAKSTKLTFPKIFGKHLLQMADQDSSLFCISPATPVGSELVPFMEKYPERSQDVGIAENHAVSFAGGLAKSGHLKVVVCVYATFLQRALDNIFQEICLQRLPVLIAIDRASLSGPDGSTHHGIYDIAFLNAMPGLIICQPRNGRLLKELMNSAFDWQAPVALRYPNIATEEENDKPLLKRDPGVGEIICEGSDVIIVALGHMLDKALEVKELLAPFGIIPTIVDPIFIKPLDKSLFHKLFLTHRHLVVIEEHAQIAGLSTLLSHLIVQGGHGHLTVQYFGIPDRFIEHGENDKLYDELGLTPIKMAKKIARAIASKELV